MATRAPSSANRRAIERREERRGVGAAEQGPGQERRSAFLLPSRVQAHTENGERKESAIGIVVRRPAASGLQTDGRCEVSPEVEQRGLPTADEVERGPASGEDGHGDDAGRGRPHFAGRQESRTGKALRVRRQERQDDSPAVGKSIASEGPLDHAGKHGQFLHETSLKLVSSGVPAGDPGDMIRP